MPPFAAFAEYFETQHAFAFVLLVLDPQLAEFHAPRRVEQQRGQGGPVTLALDRVVLGDKEQLVCLVIAERRRFAFAAFGLWPLDAFDRIVGNGDLLAEMSEQGGKRREPMPNGGTAKATRCQILAPADDVGAPHSSEFRRSGNTGETHKIRNRMIVGAATVPVADVGEQFNFGRQVGKVVDSAAVSSRLLGTISEGSRSAGLLWTHVVIAKIRWTNPLRGIFVIETTVSQLHGTRLRQPSSAPLA